MLDGERAPALRGPAGQVQTWRTQDLRRADNQPQELQNQPRARGSAATMRSTTCLAIGW
jgi:hypothetical protein